MKGAPKSQFNPMGWLRTTANDGPHFCTPCHILGDEPQSKVRAMRGAAPTNTPCVWVQHGYNHSLVRRNGTTSHVTIEDREWHLVVTNVSSRQNQRKLSKSPLILLSLSIIRANSPTYKLKEAPQLHKSSTVAPPHYLLYYLSTIANATSN